MFRFALFRFIRSLTHSSVRQFLCSFISESQLLLSRHCHCPLWLPILTINGKLRHDLGNMQLVNSTYRTQQFDCFGFWLSKLPKVSKGSFQLPIATFTNETHIYPATTSWGVQKHTGSHLWLVNCGFRASKELHRLFERKKLQDAIDIIIHINYGSSPFEIPKSNKTHGSEKYHQFVHDDPWRLKKEGMEHYKNPYEMESQRWIRKIMRKWMKRKHE